MQIEINAEDVFAVLSGAYAPAFDGDADLVSDGIAIAMVRQGAIVAIACSHPSHGARTPYGHFQDRLRAICLKKTEEICPQCGGGGWLDVQGAVAKQIRSFALLLGAYRGITFKPLSTRFRKDTDV